MLTVRPSPRIRDLVRALLVSPPGITEVTAPWRGDGEVAGLLSRSSWSLALIAIWRRRLFPAAAPRVWIPESLAEPAIQPLRLSGAVIVRYPLDGALEPDARECDRLAAGNTVDVFVIVHQLGRPCRTDAARQLCAKHGGWLVEDAVHALRPVGGIGTQGHFVLYSPHKHLAVPDGAVLVARSPLDAAAREAIGPPSSWPAQLVAVDVGLQHGGSTESSATLGWLTRSMLDRWVARRAISRRIPLTGPAASQTTVRLLRGARSQLIHAARERRRKLLLWDALVAGERDGGARPGARPGTSDWLPAVASYEVERAAAGLRHRWQHHRLPVCASPAGADERTACLATHHRLDEREMTRRFVRSESPRHETSRGLRIEWDKASREQWTAWLTSAGRSNLLQAWAYGEAKAASGGLAVSRAVFFQDEAPIAIAQVLQKRLGPVGIMRVNRGPLMLSEPTPATGERLLRLMARDLGAGRLRPLSIAPETPLTGESIASLSRPGLRRIARPGAQSVWIDLRKDLPALRASLRGKWKRWAKDLDSPEKRGLSVDASTDVAAFEWMMHRYRELMLDRDFAGPPVSLVEQLRARAADREELVTVRAYADGEPVAGICLAAHGAAATYLVGWNGPLGRKLAANQFLFWFAIRYLKEQGFQWFDLGGLDEDKTPGITDFKLGMGGQPYELVGEYLAW